MPNLFRTMVSEPVDAMFRSHLSETVSYRRGHREVPVSMTMQAAQGESIPATQTQGEASHRLQEFTATTADLVTAELFPPQEGDEIVALHGTFRLASPIGLPVYRDSDGHGVTTRLFAVKVADA